MIEILIITGVLSVCLSWAMLFHLRKHLLRWHVIDTPNERSSHTIETPRGGGISIVIITLGGLLLYLLYNREFFIFLLPYIIGGAIIAFISWIDDLRSMPRKTRFIFQCIVAVLSIYGFGYFKIMGLPLLGQLNLSWLGLPLTFLWIVGLTNSYNFMDGIDGIAGCQAVVAALGWAIIGWSNDLPYLVVFMLLLAGSNIGFLFHNWSPARIFMGDVGSIFLGYTFACLPLMLNAEKHHNWSQGPLIGALMVWPFFFDAVLTFLRRWWNGEKIFKPHRSHLYQRLVIAGYSHSYVTLLYTGLSCISVLLALSWMESLSGSSIAVILLIPLLSIKLWLYTISQERNFVKS